MSIARLNLLTLNIERIYRSIETPLLVVDEKGVIGFPESPVRLPATPRFLWRKIAFHVTRTLNVNNFHANPPHINPGVITSLSFPNGIMSEPGSVEANANPKIPLRAAASGLESARSATPISCKICRKRKVSERDYDGCTHSRHADGMLIE